MRIGSKVERAIVLGLEKKKKEPVQRKGKCLATYSWDSDSLHASRKFQGIVKEIEVCFHCGYDIAGYVEFSGVLNSNNETTFLCS